MSLLDTALISENLWLLGIGLFAAMALCARLGARLRQAGGTERDGEGGGEGYLLSAALALLGLLIAFTFSLALNRYDTRRALVVTEANAISTTWLRAELAGESSGTELQRAIADYTDVRLKLPAAEDNAESVEVETVKAQAKLWADMRAAIRDAPPPVAATIVTATNEMFDVASARKAERIARVPGRVIEVLILYAMMSAAIVGYVLGGSGGKHRVVTTILFALLTLALLLILDLDRPWSGGITVSQQPMLDARAAMR